jgi:porphobilinogen deaminase
VPLGALATVHADRLRLRAAVLDAAGRQRVEGEVAGCADDAEKVGCQLTDDLLRRGARELLTP